MFIFTCQPSKSNTDGVLDDVQRILTVVTDAVPGYQLLPELN